MLNLAVTQRAQYLDPNGVPYSGARLSFLDVNTGFLKSIYADPDSVTELTNPIILDIGGYVPESGVFYGDGNYSIKLEKLDNPGEPIPTYSQVWHMPNVPGTAISATGAGLSYVYLESVEDIQNLPLGTYDYVYAFNYYSNNNDKGGGWFKWEPASTATTNLGTIFALSASPSIGRFIRKYEGNITTAMFGCCPNRGVNMSSRITQAATWAISNSQTLEFENGTIEIDGTVIITACDVQINAGFKFTRLTPLATSVLRFTDCNVDVQQITEAIAYNGDATSYIQFYGDINFKLYPAWFGAVGNGVFDDFTAFYTASLSDGVIQIVRAYKITAAGALGTPTLTLERVRLVGAGFINNGITSITVFNCSGDGDALNNFRSTDNELTGWTFNFIGHAQWFMNLTPSANLLLALQQTALTKKMLIWDYPDTFVLPSGAYDLNVQFTNEVKFGTLLTIQTDGQYIGNIVAGTYQIFTEVVEKSLALPHCFVQWWGGGAISSAVTNTRAIDNAINSAGGFSYGIVDGNGERMDLGSNISYSSSRNVIIQNVELSSAGITLQFDGTNDVQIRNSKINNVQTSTATSIKLINVEFDGNTTESLLFGGVNISVINCEFTSYASITFGTSAVSNSVVIVGNTFGNIIVNLYTGSKTNSFSGNTINSWQRRAGTADQNVIVINGGSHTSICNNTLTAIDTSIADQDTYLMKFIGLGEIVQGLVCTDNNFYVNQTETQPITAGSDWFTCTASGYATYGHDAIVKDNINTGGQTRGLSSYKIDRATHYQIGKSNVQGTVFVNFFWGIFPYREQLTNIIVSPQKSDGSNVVVDGIIASGGLYQCTIHLTRDGDGNDYRNFGFLASCARNVLR